MSDAKADVNIRHTPDARKLTHYCAYKSLQCCFYLVSDATASLVLQTLILQQNNPSIRRGVNI
jgi:hypothetical protein